MEPIPLQSIVVYGLGLLPLVIVMIVLLVILLYNVGMRGVSPSRPYPSLPMQQGQRQGQGEGQGETEWSTSTMLVTIEQRLAALERQGDREHETLMLMLDRLTSRSRTQQRKSPRED
jgi:tRNA C32,U32 (ribose-2'-O)-methylase TrmJ